MKYFINGNEINFGDKFFHVKESNFGDFTSTTTFEGVFTKKSVKQLIELGVVTVKPDEEDSHKIIDDLERNIKMIEKMTKVIQKLL